jgi:tRNA pseudouridine65 synthase
MHLDLLYQDEHLVAVNKPHGLLVHRSSIARDVEEFALQILRDQLNQHVWPVHRLDRKTAGVLLFALNEEALKETSKLFAENKVAKIYLAIVRGYSPDADEIDYPLKKENGKLQEAVTNYRTLARAELPLAFGKHATSRYSLVEVKPETGRMHQIRKHFAHIFHPIIGDRPHGCNKQNKHFKERWQMTNMLLHAHALSFQHPLTKEHLTISASLQAEFMRMVELMGFESALQEVNIKLSLL